MNKALHGVAQEISHNLALEMLGQAETLDTASPSILDFLLERLVQEVVRQLGKPNLSNSSSYEALESRLRKAEKALRKLAIRTLDDDEDEIAGAGSAFPNLKYAKPKYKDMESVLKYIERDGDNRGVKLVIMNFND